MQSNGILFNLKLELRDLRIAHGIRDTDIKRIGAILGGDTGKNTIFEKHQPIGKPFWTRRISTVGKDDILRVAPTGRVVSCNNAALSIAGRYAAHAALGVAVAVGEDNTPVSMKRCGEIHLIVATQIHRRPADCRARFARRDEDVTRTICTEVFPQHGNHRIVKERAREIGGATDTLPKRNRAIATDVCRTVSSPVEREVERQGECPVIVIGIPSLRRAGCSERRIIGRDGIARHDCFPPKRRGATCRLQLNRILIVHAPVRQARRNDGQRIDPKILRKFASRPRAERVERRHPIVVCRTVNRSFVGVGIRVCHADVFCR